jgi:hypothetical protein
MAEDARRVAREAIKRFESGETDFEEFFDGRGARTLMIRDQEDPRFFRMESETKSHDFVVTMTGMKLDPEGRPPRDYPKEVPFVPMATAVVMLMPFSRSTMVRWENPPDPLAAFADVKEQLEDTGWERAESEGRATGSETAASGIATGSEPSGPESAPDTRDFMPSSSDGSKVIFQKGSVTRTLVLFQGKERTDLLLTEELTEVEEGAAQIEQVE